jgi:hypothetical protein
MKKILLCSVLMLSVSIVSYSYAQAEKLEICAAKSEPSRAASPDASKKISIAKPVIKNVTVREEGRNLIWVVSIENTGTAPTSGQESVQCYRNIKSRNPPQLPAGGVAVPVIDPGQTKEVGTTLNPDPQTGQYTVELVSKGKVIQQRPYGLGTPTLEVGAIKTDNDKLAWEAVIKNTWSFAVGDIKVQAFKKSASQKDWEALGETNIDYLARGASSTVRGKGNSAGADEFKVTVFLRRVKAEPWVEMVSKTLNLKQ